MDARRPDRLAALSGLRFAAATGILLFHVGAPLLAGAPGWAERIRAGGHVWVGLFYLLSGFVLAHARPTPLDPPARRAFLAARLARLYPAYLLGFVLFAPFALERWSDGGPSATAKACTVALACLLLAQAWVTPLARIWNPPGWSTSVVASFYLAFPRILAWLAPRSRAGLWRAAAAAWAIVLAFPLAYLALAPDGPGAAQLAHEPAWLAALKFHPLARGGEFVVGVALGLLVRARGTSLGRWGGPAAVAALLAVPAVLAWGRAPYVLLHNGLLLPLFAVAMVGLASDPHARVARLLGSPAGRVLGDASFALYALQDPLWRWARGSRGRAGPADRGVRRRVRRLRGRGAVVAARWLERPARRSLRALLGGGGRERGGAVDGDAPAARPGRRPSEGLPPARGLGFAWRGSRRGAGLHPSTSPPRGRLDQLAALQLAEVSAGTSPRCSQCDLGVARSARPGRRRRRRPQSSSGPGLDRSGVPPRPRSRSSLRSARRARRASTSWEQPGSRERVSALRRCVMCDAS